LSDRLCDDIIAAGIVIWSTITKEDIYCASNKRARRTSNLQGNTAISPERLVESFSEPQLRFPLVQLLLKPVKLNGRLVLVHAMKAYRGTGV
jgi:hypothetical protein